MKAQSKQYLTTSVIITLITPDKAGPGMSACRGSQSVILQVEHELDVLTRFLKKLGNCKDRAPLQMVQIAKDQQVMQG